MNSDLIRSRYPKTFTLVPKALELADEGYIIDNSNEPDVVAEKHDSELIINKSAKDFILLYLKV